MQPFGLVRCKASPLLRTLCAKLVCPMSDEFRKITKSKAWKDKAKEILCAPEFGPCFINDFHTAWTESGHHIREQIGDDAYLVKLLRHVLPKYKGGSLILFRGENYPRWINKEIGLCWTSKKNTARMFGRGLNAFHSGGVLLKCIVQSDWIISGPSAHSHYLGELEYTIDPGALSGIEVVEKYEAKE